MIFISIDQLSSRYKHIFITFLITLFRLSMSKLVKRQLLRTTTTQNFGIISMRAAVVCYDECMSLFHKITSSLYLWLTTLSNSVGTVLRPCSKSTNTLELFNSRTNSAKPTWGFSLHQRFLQLSQAPWRILIPSSQIHVSLLVDHITPTIELNQMTPLGFSIKVCWSQHNPINI